MRDLIERLESAAGPSIELDEEIRIAVGAESINHYPGEGMVTTEECYGPPEYTSSVDAALTLVPEGHVVGLRSYGDGAWRGSVRRLEDTSGNWFLGGEVEIPALSICIAALKARAALTGEERRG